MPQCTHKTLTVYQTFICLMGFIYSIQICEISHQSFGPSCRKCLTCLMIFMNTVAWWAGAAAGNGWITHDDVIKWKHFPRYWPFMRGIHRSPAQRPVKQSFDAFFDLHLNKRLSKQSWGWWFETHYDVIVMISRIRGIWLCFWNVI